ncbi:MAG: hypothetical protein ACRDJP_12505, partial [Actinomycetota bacterium]
MLVRTLRIAFVVGLVIWVLGLAWISIQPYVEYPPNFDIDLLSIGYAVESIGFRVAMASLLILVAIAVWRRWFPEVAATRRSPAELSELPAGSWWQPSGTVLLVALWVWIAAAAVTRFYRPSFEQVSAWWMQIALLIDVVAYRVAILAAVNLALRWLRLSSR